MKNDGELPKKDEEQKEMGASNLPASSKV